MLTGAMDSADTATHDAIPRPETRTVAPNFVTDAIDDDLRAGRIDEVVTRRYRSTSLVSYEDGAWRLWHLHVSPSEG